MRRVSIHLQLTIRKSYIERNDFIQQSFQKVVKCIFSKKKNFFFSELGLKQNGCIEVKSATGLYFSTSGVDIYLSIKIKKEKKP